MIEERYETIVVDEDTTCVRTTNRAAAKALATKLIRDEKSFEVIAPTDVLYWEFLISETNEGKRWWRE